MEDPLENYRGLSVFPRTLSSLLPNKPPDDDPLSIHNFLKSLPVKNPNKLIEQAKKILDSSSSSQLPNIEMPMPDMASRAADSEVAAGEKLNAESPRGRRQGLGRKRPRFSLLPNSSQSTALLEPTLDIDKLKDPEEFFLAFERLENAKKEIAKQTGRVSLDTNQYSTSLAPRPHRPGIPGRSRTARYQHLYPTMSSQENFEEDILSPSDHGSQPKRAYADVVPQEREAENVASEETEMAASITKVENRIEKLLDELLAHDYEELDGDGAVNILQERLQIKPLDIEKLHLPELQDIRRIDLKSSGGKMPKPRNVLSDIHNLLKVARSKTPGKQKKSENSVTDLGSPTPPKSPLASLSALKKHIMQSNSSSDAFSSKDIYHSPTINASPDEDDNNYPEPVNMDKELMFSGKLKSLSIEDGDGVLGDTSMSKVAMGDFTSSLDKALNDNLVSLGVSSDAGLIKPSVGLEGNTGGVDHGVIDENLSQHDADADADADDDADADADVCSGAPVDLEDRVEDMLHEASAASKSDIAIEDIAVETLNSVQNQFDQSGPAVVEDHAISGCAVIPDGPSEQMQDTAPEGLKDVAPEGVQDTDAEQHNEQPSQQIQQPSVKSMNGRTKAQSRTHKGKKALSRRQSLAASGSSWQSGIRRSTRIKSRPLEYWKGERFLYGRIHGSLATVIGIKKYESPAKDSRKATMKVMSYVSDEYKDLVQLAALH